MKHMGERDTQQYCVRISTEIAKKMKIFAVIESRNLDDLTTQALQEFIDRRYKIPQPNDKK